MQSTTRRWQHLSRTGDGKNKREKTEKKRKVREIQQSTTNIKQKEMQVITTDNESTTRAEFETMEEVVEYVRRAIDEKMGGGVSLSGFDYGFWFKDEAACVDLFDFNNLRWTCRVYGIEEDNRRKYLEETVEYIEDLFRELLDPMEDEGYYTD